MSDHPRKKARSTRPTEGPPDLLSSLLGKSTALSSAGADMAKQEAQRRQEERSTKEQALIGEDLVVFVRQAIAGARKAADQRQQGGQSSSSRQPNFEVEARLGLLCDRHAVVGKDDAPRRAVFSKRGCGAKSLDDGEFASGVSETAAAQASETIERLVGFLHSNNPTRPPTTTTTESSFGSEDPALRDVRFVVTETTARLETKKSAAVFTAALPSAKFDLRISAAVEAPLSSLPEDKVASNLKIWHSHRLKRRTSTAYRYWRIDETFVRKTPYVGLSTEQANALASFSSKNSDENIPKGGVSNNSSDDTTNDASDAQPSSSSSRNNRIQWELNTAAEIQETREIELELDARYVESWLASNDDEPLVQELVSLLAALNPLERVDTRFDPSVEPSSPDIGILAAQQLRKSLPKLLGVSESEDGPGVARRFPGSMPVGFCRRHLKLVQRPDDYAVAEKSDGERRLLIIFETTTTNTETRRRCAALVDRSLKYRLVRLTKAALDAMPPGVVLDGEIVFNLDQRVPVFLVFDVLHDGKSEVTEKIFDTRYFGTLSHLTGPLNGALCALCPSTIDDEAAGNVAVFRDIVAAEREGRRNDVDTAAAADPVALKDAPTVYLVPKRFARPKDVASKVIKHIARDNDVGGLVAYGSRVFAEGPAKVHLTDGLIFVPRKAPYHLGSDADLFKWKWPDGLTVDLQVKGGGRGGDLSLYATADDGDQVDCSKHVVLPPHDEARLRADVGHYDKGLVVELGLDPATGLWTYHGPRPDKDMGNHFDVFVSTLLLHAESPDQAELEYRLKITDPTKDDWSKLMAAALARATTPWREHFSKTNNRVYWWNRETFETTWERPHDLVLGL